MQIKQLANRKPLTEIRVALGIDARRADGPASTPGRTPALELVPGFGVWCRRGSQAGP